MHAQYEQHCNAAGAAVMGATVARSLDEHHYPTIRQWLDTGRPIKADYPDETAQIVAHVVQKHGLPRK